MKLLFYTCALVALSISACNSTGTKNTENTGAEQPVIAQADTHELKVAKERARSQFNSLEKLFDNANYMIIEGKDTNYLYFSRNNDYLIKTHAFKMINGDSSNVRIDSIQLDEHNNIKWNFGEIKLALKNTTDMQAIWNLNGSDSIYYQFQKSGYNTIQFVQVDGKKKLLKKTIALSAFLVRSYYDFTHGTKLAFDTTNFTKKQ
jgi:hypothetical protein